MFQSRRFCSLYLGLLLLFGCVSGCGYGVPGAVTRLPEDVKTISLGPIENRTREVGLEKALLDALEDEISLRGRLQVLPPGQGDVILSGAIRDYLTRPVSFNSRDEALQYQASMAVDLTLRRRDDQKLLWKTSGLREVEDYSAIPGVVVTSSSQFQQSAVNAKDLARLSDIQVSEGQRREANERLLETLSRSIYNQMLEDF